MDYTVKAKKYEEKLAYDSNKSNNILSVIVVTYNQEKYLYETIDSILMQSYKKIELIIADDGTPDFDANGIKAYIENSNKGNICNTVILYDGINRGTVKNLNIALKKTSGEFIKIIGGDDTYYDANVFLKEVQYLSLHKYLYGAVSKCQQCDAFMNSVYDFRVEKSNKSIQKVLNMSYNESRKFIVEEDIFPIATQATIFRQSFFSDNGYCDEEYIVIDDASTALKILKNHKKFAFLDMFSVNHRSDVGISTSKEIFSVRRLKYYKDCVTYANKEFKINSQVYGKLYSYFIPLVNEYVYKMALVKSQNKRSLKFAILTVKYCPSLIYYLAKNYKKVTRRFMIASKH